MTLNKPIASLSLDLDNQWTYMKTHADPGWETFPSFLDVLVPRALDLLEKHRLKITFFIVGQDAALEKNHAALRSVAESGHEIGNHSFNHEPWLHLYSEEQFEEDLLQAEEHIERVTSQKQTGFRGPGYSITPMVLQVLARHHYEYDASTLPTFIGPLARAYYFFTTKLDSEEKECRKLLYGEWRDGFKPIRPYRCRTDACNCEVLEIPVSTLPFFRLPFHISYVLYISGFSPLLAKTYFHMAMMLCRLSRINPSLLLHSLDFVGCNEIKELSFFPAMQLSAQKKLERVSDILRIYSKYYTIVHLAEHARALFQEKDIATLKPPFSAIGNPQGSKR